MTEPTITDTTEDYTQDFYTRAVPVDVGTITDHEDTLIADLNTAEGKLRDIAKICRNHDLYTSKSLATIILARINRKGRA